MGGNIWCGIKFLMIFIWFRDARWVVGTAYFLQLKKISNDIWCDVYNKAFDYNTISIKYIYSRFLPVCILLPTGGRSVWRKSAKYTGSTQTITWICLRAGKVLCDCHRILFSGEEHYCFYFHFNTKEIQVWCLMLSFSGYVFFVPNNIIHISRYRYSIVKLVY